MENPREGYRQNFVGNYFSMIYRVFGVFLTRDSEYDVYFLKNEFLIVKISKYNHLLVVALTGMVKTTVLSYSAAEKKTDA
jgi:hypothetical protein